MPKVSSTSKQHTELLRSVPSSCLQCDVKALKIFVEWAEASQVSKTPGVSLLIKRFALASNVTVQVCSLDFDLIGREAVGELLTWIEASREECSIPETSLVVLSMLLLYQDRIQAYKECIRNYWTEGRKT